MPAQGGTNAQSVAYQRELLYGKIDLLYQDDHYLLDRIEEGKDKLPDLEQSSRESRFPIDILAGGKPAQVNPNGGATGRGSVPTPDVARMTPIYLDFVTEFTKEYEVTTNSKTKGVEDAAKHATMRAVEQFKNFEETLLNTDGSGTLDTVVSTVLVTGAISVNNPDAFMDNEEIQVFSGLGGTNRGSFTVVSVDSGNKALFYDSLPLGTVAGDLLIIKGASGTAASSVFGTKYHHVNSNTGIWMQIDRSAYPGKITTSQVPMGSQSITPQSMRLGLNLVRRALGSKTPDLDNGMFHMNLDQEAAWENVGLAITENIYQQIGGTASEDQLKKTPPKTIAGRPILASIQATPGRIDFLCLKHWLKTTTQPFGPLEFGGQSIFPTYASDGSVEFNSESVLWHGFQVATTNPRAGCFWSSCAVPNGY